MSLLSAIGGLVGLAVGGPMGAAVGAGIGKGAEGGDLGDMFKSGLKGFFGGQFINAGIGALGGAAGAAGSSPSQTALASILGGRGGGAAGGAASGGINPLFQRAAAASQGVQQVPVIQNSAQARQPGVNATGSTGILGLAQQNPFLASLLVEALDQSRYPDGVKVLSPYQERQLETGERVPDYQGTPAPMVTYAAEGGLIEGPGTGTSDSIPAQIYQNGAPVQEARLSDGEFVLREKDVEAVGDGDQAKGAARLYAMQRQFDRMGA